MGHRRAPSGIRSYPAGHLRKGSFGTLLDDRDPDVRQAFAVQSNQQKQVVSNCTAFLGIVEHEYELCASDKTCNCAARQRQGFPNVPVVGIPFLCIGIDWLDPR